MNQTESVHSPIRLKVRLLGSYARFTGTPVFDRTISTGFKLSIFALEDGKNHVAQITKQMAVAVTEGDRFSSDSINVQLVDKWMSGIYSSINIHFTVLENTKAYLICSREHFRA